MSVVKDLITGPKKPSTAPAEAAAERATALQERMYEEGVERQQPFYDIGLGGMEELARMMGIQGDAESAGYGSFMQPVEVDVMADPGISFAREQGEQALERQLAAQGKTLSPEAAKELMQFNQNLATQQYGTALDRQRAQQTDIYNRLANLAGVGQQQATGLTNLGQQYASNVGNIGTSLANAQMAAQQADTANRMAMLGTIVKGGAAAAGAMSDIRAKKNIEKVGEKNGLNIYHFDYKDKPGRFEGVMAQEVLEKMPEAVVTMDDGHLGVRYDLIGIEMKEIN